MRFGFFVPQGWRMDLAGIDPAQHWATMRDLARHADAGPWDSIWVYDHFHTVPEPSDEATHEAWSLMAAFAAATERVHLGQMCTCMSYRNPMYLAKVAATVDHVSGGRLQMGIGGGWYEHEWRAYGYGFPSAGERLARLDEGVQVMRQAWTEGRVSFDGRQYQVDGAICRPLPIQAGGPPLWIAGGGEQKTLRTAAKYAQYTNFDATPDVFRHKSQVLAEHCRELGRDFAEIVRSGSYNVIIGETARDVEDKLAWAQRHYATYTSAERAERTASQLRTGPLVGTVEQVVDGLSQARELGVGYAICYFLDAAYDRSSIDLFAEKVIPALS